MIMILKMKACLTEGQITISLKSCLDRFAIQTLYSDCCLHDFFNTPLRQWWVTKDLNAQICFDLFVTIYLVLRYLEIHCKVCQRCSSTSISHET